MSVFGLWSMVIPDARRYANEHQLTLPGSGFSRVTSPREASAKPPRKAGKVS
jgi:hypothetical protein